MRPATRPRILSMLVLLVTLIALPLAAVASDTFGDVPDSNVFHDDINAIADAGVTTGCGGGNYCPSEYVTREQMAAFMNRLGALSVGKTPVVNADKVDGYDAGSINRVALASGGTPSTPFLHNTNGELSTTITAPARGWLVINAHSALYLDTADPAEVTCSIQVNNTSVDTSFTIVDLDYDGGSSPPIFHDEDDCNSAANYKVCAAGAYTIDFAFTGVASQLVDVKYAVLQVEFVPFGATGAAPSLASCLVL